MTNKIVSVDDTYAFPAVVQTAQNAIIDARIASSSAVKLAVATTVTASGAAVANKHNPVDATSGPLTITLPTGQPAGTTLVVEKSDSTVNTVTTSGSIRGVGSSTLALTLAKESMEFLADSAGSWWPIAGHKTLGSLKTVLAPVTAKYLTTPTGGDDTALIQAVIDSAGADDIVRITGTYVIASTVIIKGHFDGTGAVFNYSGSGLAVQVGSTSAVTYRKRVLLPRIICTNKPTTGWTAGTIGVMFVNMNSCDAIHVSHVENFEVGMQVYGQGTGISYCTFMIGHLSNNKINQQLAADATGWSNQNTYIGGRYGHNSPEGLNVAGSRQVDLVTGLNSPPNNNLWLNASFEYGTAEFHLNVAGSNNLWINCRFEVTGGARVRWQADAIANQIFYGYKSDTIASTVVAGATRNHMLTPQKWSVSTGFGVTVENTSSNASGALAVMPAGAAAAGTDPAVGYSGRLAANAWAGKRTLDANDRVQLDMQNGRIYLGNGVLAPVSYWQGTTVSMILGGGAHLTFATDNTADVGTALNRPRYVRAGTALQTGADTTANRPSAVTAGAGASFFDTSLGRTIWSDGSVWLDPLATVGGPAAPGLNGLLGWSFDPSAITTSTLVTAGVLTGARVWLPATSTVTELVLNVGLAGAGLTAGQCFAALYTAAGALLGVTADQSTTWLTTGTKFMALAGGTQVLAAGFYDVAFWSNGTTQPKFFDGIVNSVANMGLTAANSRYWTADTGVTAAAPATRATRVSNTTSYWAGLR